MVFFFFLRGCLDLFCSLTSDGLLFLGVMCRHWLLMLVSPAASPTTIALLLGVIGTSVEGSLLGIVMAAVIGLASALRLDDAEAVVYVIDLLGPVCSRPLVTVSLGFKA